MITTANYIIKAVVNGEHYVFQYEECGDTWEALELFWHDDFDEMLAQVPNNGVFPIDVIAMDDGKAIAVHEFTFNLPVFAHFFDKGWSASSTESQQCYTLEQFAQDIAREKEEKPNDVSSFFFYMWNAWCFDECKRAFADGDYQHFWNKWCALGKKYGFGAVEEFYAELSETNRRKLVTRATEVYNENKRIKY